MNANEDKDVEHFLQHGNELKKDLVTKGGQVSHDPGNEATRRSTLSHKANRKWEDYML